MKKNTLIFDKDCEDEELDNLDTGSNDDSDEELDNLDTESVDDSDEDSSDESLFDDVVSNNTIGNFKFIIDKNDKIDFEHQKYIHVIPTSKYDRFRRIFKKIAINLPSFLQNKIIYYLNDQSILNIYNVCVNDLPSEFFSTLLPISSAELYLNYLGENGLLGSDDETLSKRPKMIEKSDNEVIIGDEIYYIDDYTDNRDQNIINIIRDSYGQSD